jgi:Mrp family chromosome partitioning ATPase/uncharacterized protein involved in exopolysaccharide biosynthesis
MKNVPSQLPAGNRPPAGELAQVRPRNGSASPDHGFDVRAVGAAGGSPRPQSSELKALRTLHGLMRGRYALAVVLGLVAAAFTGALGWKLARPVYRSESMVRIAYTLPQVKGENDLNRPLPMFAQFMASQRLLIASRSAIDYAAKDPVWKGFGRRPPEEIDRYFEKNLTVDVKPNSEYIVIAVNDYDAATATAAVRAITSAYKDLYDKQYNSTETQRTGVLQDELTKLDLEIQQKDQELREKAKPFGTTDLGVLCEASAMHVNKLETALWDLRLAKYGAPSQPVTAGEAESTQSTAQIPAQTRPSTQPTQQPGFDPERIAMTDPTMAAYFREQTRLEDELARLEHSGFGPAHMRVTSTQQELEQAKSRVRNYAERYAKFQAATGQAPTERMTNPRVITAGKTREAIEATESQLAQELEDAIKDRTRLGNTRMDLQRLDAELKAKRDEQAKLKQRVDELAAERSLGGRLTVLSWGEVPLSPQKDTKVRFAAAGAFAGAGLPGALILAGAFLRRRYRFSDDTESDSSLNVPLLGILPELKEMASDGEDVIAAAHSVHQLRVSLQAQSGHDRPRVYLVTSATAGEGKTSLAMSLGLSFAASDLRTLVIDGDLVGRQLTGACHAEELDGLQEALAGGSLRKLVRKTHGGLYILPTGKSAAAADACKISASGSKQLLTDARRYFEVILIDSGPILGSLEASVLAREVDGVIFTIVRGQHRVVVQQALRRLQSLGAHVIGFIFNRAKPTDFHGSAYGSSARSSAAADQDVTLLASNRFHAMSGYGPLVKAVASGMPAAAN